MWTNYYLLILLCIKQGEASDAVRNAYMTVADKYQDVLTLEASVSELHQMFLDFALLTEQQGMFIFLLVIRNIIISIININIRRVT